MSVCVSTLCGLVAVGGMCVVRGPPAAAWAVRTAKRFVDPETAAKIELHAPAQTPDAVRRLLGEASIPHELSLALI